MSDDTFSQARSVLVVDDDPSVLALLTSILEGPRTAARPKIRVLRARSVEEAVEVLSRKYVPVDLILSNRVFAGSGELSDRAAGVRPDVPLMYMSAQSDEETIRIQDPGTTGSGFLGSVVSAFPKVGVKAAGVN